MLVQPTFLGGTETVTGLPAHADPAQMTAWLGRMTKPPGRVFVTH